MAKPLTDTQRAFIAKYVTNKTGKEKARIIKQYQDFDRRRGKMEAELTTLPPDHPDLPLLRGQLATADAKAKGPADGSAPAFGAAYDDLKAVKRDARGAAKGYKKALTPATVTARLDAIANGLAPIDQILRTNKQNMADLVAEVKATPVPPVKNYDDVVAFQASLTKREARWRGDADLCRTMAATAGGMVTAMGAEQLVKAAQHDLLQLKAGADKKTAAAIGPLEQRLSALEAQAKPGGSYRTDASAKAEFAEQDKQLTQAVRQLRNVQVRDGAPDTGDRFKKVEGREKAILDRAGDAYRIALANDAALDPKLARPSPPKGPPPMGKFDAADMIGHGMAWLKEEDINDDAVQKAAGLVKAKTAAFIAKEAARTPNSDKLFDLATRSLNDLREEVGASLGLAGPASGWPPKSRQLAEAGARAIKEALMENSPNKPSDATVAVPYKGQNRNVPATVTQNGITYGNPEILGEGGVGLITRYQGPANGGAPSTVVMKSTLAGSADDFWAPDTKAGEDEDDKPRALKKREEMVKEMRVHRALMGGENGVPNPNVVEMKGAAVGSDGSLHMILEEAEAGDANEFGHAVSTLVGNGTLPKAAQQALQQDTMLQAVRGLKAVHDLGVLHNDIKAVNYLVDRNGMVKAADFGSGDTMEQGADKGAAAPANTQIYAAPEYGDGARTEKSDIYALGAMLHGASAEHGVDGKIAESEGWSVDFKQQATTGHGATSLDRLRNAMMAPNPADRPTLEGILMSSYLNDARDQYGDADAPNAGGPATDPVPMATLRKAMAAYSQAVGREVAKINQEISYAEGGYAAEARKTKDPDILKQKRAAADATIAPLRAALDAINARPEVAPLLDAVKKAGEAFGTAKGNERDNAWDFAYRKTMDGIDRITSRRTAPDLPGNLEAALQDPELQPVPAQ